MRPRHLLCDVPVHALPLLSPFIFDDANKDYYLHCTNKDGRLREYTIYPRSQSPTCQNCDLQRCLSLFRQQTLLLSLRLRGAEQGTVVPGRCVLTLQWVCPAGRHLRSVVPVITLVRSVLSLANQSMAFTPVDATLPGGPLQRQILRPHHTPTTF